MTRVVHIDHLIFRILPLTLPVRSQYAFIRDRTKRDVHSGRMLNATKEDLMNAIRVSLWRSTVCGVVIGFAIGLANPAPVRAAVCGDDLAEAPETCDGTDDSACPGLCPGPSDPLACQCPVCGDNVANQLSETCD